MSPSQHPTTLGLRVGLVAPGFPPQLGGVETVVGELADGLHASGCSVAVYAQRPRRWTAPDDKPYPVHRFADVTRSRRFSVAPSLMKGVRSDRAGLDVLHAHSFHAAPALMAALVSDTPLVFTPHFHGVGHTRAARMAHLLYDPLARRLFDRSARVTCVSYAEAELVASCYPRAQDRIVVIPNGVDVAAIEAAVPYSVDSPVVLVAGRLEQYKRVDLVMQAVSLLSAVRLVISGVGPQEPALRRLARDLGIAHRVDFLGFLPLEQLRRWQRTAAVTVSMSEQEAFGLVVLEAAAAGSAIVASEIPAHRELLDQLGDRLTLVQSRPDAIAAAVLDALSSAHGSPAATDIMTWPEVVARVAAEYANVRR